MPTVTRDGVSLYYDTDGDGETVAFLGDVGLGAWQWAWQHRAVAGPFESLVMDPRGVGRSDSPAGPYSVDALAADVEAVLADAGARRAHLVGSGLGGLVALSLARGRSRVASVCLLGTAADGSVPDLDPLRVDPTDEAACRESLTSLLSADFLADRPGDAERVVEWRREGDATPSAWDAQAAAVRAFDASDWLYEVTVPALVLHGEHDAVWPHDAGRRLADGLPRGSFEPVPDAGHLVGIDAPRTVNDALVGFLEAQIRED